jgi:protein-tyrosine phosphatase
VSLEMARRAVASGVTTMACTPHILPGVWPNTGPQIRKRTTRLQEELNQAGVPLKLVTGADNYIVPNMARGLREGHLLSLADTRYVMVEVPHHVAPVRLDDCFFGLMMAGYVPVLTHPERLSWIDPHYEHFVRLVAAGVWMQITAASLLGGFGRRAQYWGERMLDDGIVHILASDAHNTTSRPPLLAEGAEVAARLIGRTEAQHLIETRPAGILANELTSKMPPPAAGSKTRKANAELADWAGPPKPLHTSAHVAEFGSGGPRLRIGRRLREFFHRTFCPP